MNAQLPEWNDIRLILAVCREGSLSGAARVLGLNHSTVFRRVNAIEEQVGVRLFERLANGYAMTEAGEAVLSAGERIENEVLALSRELVGQDAKLHGTLRLTAPDALAVKILMPHIKIFSDRFPDIRVQLSIASHFLDLGHRETDIAIRATSTPPETVIGHRLAKLATTFYGSVDYLEKQPDNKIKEYAWLMPDEELAQLPVTAWQRRHYPAARIVFTNNTYLGLYEAVKAGLGIAPLACFLADADVELKRVLEPPVELDTELWLLLHPDLKRTARVRAFVDFLLEVIEYDRDAIEGRLNQ